MKCEDTAWCPGPDWDPVAGAEGSGTVGVWRVRSGEGTWIAKRVRTNPGIVDRRSFLWAQREVEVARSGIASQFEGLAAPDCRVQEVAGGDLLWSKFVTPEQLSPSTVARALANFGKVKIADPGWFVVGHLKDRIAATDSGGVGRLQNSLDRVLGDLVRQIWDRREAALHTLESLPHVLSHGDALPRNFLSHDTETGRVVAIDWDQIGFNSVGADLASYWMWTQMEAEVLLSDFIDALEPGTATLDEVESGFALTVALIAVMRAARSEGVQSYHDRLVRARGQLDFAVRLVDGPMV